MGSFSTSKQTASQKQNQTTNTDPWGPQSDYLKQIFGEASDVYDQTKGQTYNGDYVAGYDPNQIDLFNRQIQYAKTTPVTSLLQNQGQGFGSAGLDSTVQGLQGLQDFRPTGTTMGTIADAGLYADNPYISSQVDAALRDAQRATYEGTLPANARNAALTGNANSSRRFVSDAIAQRGLADRTADVSAALRGQAYNQGLTLSQNQSQFNDQASLDRANALASLGISSGSLGGNNLLGSVSSASDLATLGNNAGAGLRDANQATLDNSLAKYQGAQSDPWTALMNYYNLIGANQWGGTTNSTGKTATASTSTASPAATIGGILTAIGGLIPGKHA